MTFFIHVLRALGYVCSRTYGYYFCVAAVAIGIVYLALYFLFRFVR